MSATVLVRGVGDVGSAVAHQLLAAGFRVAIHDGPAPHFGRRGMAFVDAVYDGSALLAGTLAKKAFGLQSLSRMVACRRAIPVTTERLEAVLNAVRPDVLVDGRMRKRTTPEPQLELAPLTIGLGPNFTAGVTTHLIVETAWGSKLGRVMVSGCTLPLAGGPRQLDGFGRERVVYAPSDGLFQTSRAIGDWLEPGNLIATLDGARIYAPLAGYLRGLTRSGVAVVQGAKVIEIDPRAVGAELFGLGERPRRIAEGVVRALTTGG